MYVSLLVPRSGRGRETCRSSSVAIEAPDSKVLASSYKNDILTNELYESKSNIEVLGIPISYVIGTCQGSGKSDIAGETAKGS
jgi:hypothetical protein